MSPKCWQNIKQTNDYYYYRAHFADLPVNSEVQPHELSELWIFISQHGCEVSRPVSLRIYYTNRCAVTVKITVDYCCNGGQLGNQIHAVFINVLKYKYPKKWFRMGRKITNYSSKKKLYADEL